MITVTSNAGQVAEKLNRFLTHLPSALRTVMAPQRSWLGPARRHAEMALEAIATPAQRPWIPLVVRSITIELLGGEEIGMVWTAGRVAKAASLLDALAHQGGLGPLFETNTREEMKDLLRAWIRTPEEEGGKRRDERDFDATEDEILYRLLRVLDRGAAGEFEAATAAAVAKHVQAFSQGAGGLPGLDPVVLDTWLRAVLEAWRALLEAQLAPFTLQVLREHWRTS